MQIYYVIAPIILFIIIRVVSDKQDDIRDKQEELKEKQMENKRKLLEIKYPKKIKKAKNIIYNNMCFTGLKQVQEVSGAFVWIKHSKVYGDTKTYKIDIINKVILQCNDKS